MPAIGPTSATFGNTLISRGFDFTFAPGIQPSVCLLYTVPHTANLPQVDTLTISTQGDVSLSFRDCLLEDPKLSANQSGQIWQLPIKDRRWKWQYGEIYGHYNKSEKNGTYTRERTPRQLASILLDGMNETGYDVSRLPNDVRPERRWDGATPAVELDSLCEALGCVVVLNPFTDRVEIWPVGQGLPLPNGTTTGKAYTPILPARPSRVRVESGETLFQATWSTEAVGLDTDGRWKPLTELSYARPRAYGGFPGDAVWNGFEGWYENSNGTPRTYESGGKILNIRDLAAGTVFQCYRLTGVTGWTNGIVPPLLANTFQQPTSLKDFRFFDDLAEDEFDPQGGLQPQKAVAYAVWVRLDKRTPDFPIRYPHGFSIDPENHIISFGEPLFLFASNTNEYSIPAQVYVECSFYCGAGGTFHRRNVEADAGGPSQTPTLLVQRPEIQPRVIYRHSFVGPTGAVDDNLADVDQRLNYWGNAELAQYGLQQGGTVEYDRLMAISPDGLTQQVTWSGGGGRPAKTTASQAQRHNRYTKPLDEYRDRLKAKQLEQSLKSQMNSAVLGDVSTRVVV